MAQKFPFSCWMYNPVDDFTPEEVGVWAECGLTTPMSPKIVYGKDDPKKLIPFLDAAQEKGLQLIAHINGLENSFCYKLGAEEYERRFREVYAIIRHPALYGFYIGDEPSTKEEFECSVEAIRIQKCIAPELRPYLNLHIGMDETDPALLGGRTFRQWLKYVAEKTGFSNFSYGHYDQLVNDAGIDSYFKNIKALVEAAEEAGVDVWNTQLSSAHYMFRMPTEYDIMWQITTAAACGSRGVIWFRFYDRSITLNYHYSPVDEYGNKTPLYYSMLRCQRRFNDHYGELIMSLHHKKTYLTHQPRGGYDIFGAGSHPAIQQVRGTEQAVVSFFEDDEGGEYLCVVNASMTTPGVFRLEHDREVWKLEELTFNGKVATEYTYAHTEAHWDGLWLHPGQIGIFRITRR